MGIYLKGGILSLLLGDAVGRMSGSLRLARESWQKTSKLFHSFSMKELWQTAVRYRHFPMISSGSALINIACLALPPLLLTGLYGLQVTGWFALTDRVMHVPFILIGRAISQVYSGEFARLATVEPEALTRFFWRTARHLALTGLLPLLVMVAAGPQLFAWVFGEPWREAGHYARLLAVRHYVGLIAGPLTPTLMLLERQSWQLGWDIGLLALCAGSLWVANSLGCSASEAILAYGIALTACYLVHLWLCKLCIQRRNRDRNLPIR
jgi:O-antigen/teichoic acid export membrane protein